MPKANTNSFVSIMIKAALFAAQDVESRNSGLASDETRTMWDAYHAFVERGKVPKNDIWEKWQRYRKIAERIVARETTC